MKRNEVLFFLVATFVVVIAWVVFTILHNKLSSTISESLNMQIQQINPSFDTKTITSLKTRVQVTPATDIKQVIPEKQSSISAQPSPIPTISIVSPTSITTGTQSATQNPSTPNAP